MLQAKTWVSIVLISLLTFGSFNLAMAQPKKQGHHGMEPAQVAEHMQKELDLTDMQKEQVELIMTEQRAKAESVMDELKSIHKETKSRLDDVLTSEQIEKLEGMKSERREKMKR